MRCLDDRKIQVFVDNRVEPREYGQIITHLSECKTCQAKVEEEKRLSYFVKRAALVYGEADQLGKTILRKIEGLRSKLEWIPVPEPVSILRWIQPWAVQVAAVWVAATLLGGWLGLIIETPSPKESLVSGTMKGSLVNVLSQRAERGRS